MASATSDKNPEAASFARLALSRAKNHCRACPSLPSCLAMMCSMTCSTDVQHWPANALVLLEAFWWTDLLIHWLFWTAYTCPPACCNWFYGLRSDKRV